MINVINTECKKNEISSSSYLLCAMSSIKTVSKMLMIFGKQQKKKERKKKGAKSVLRWGKCKSPSPLLLRSLKASKKSCKRRI